MKTILIFAGILSLFFADVLTLKPVDADVAVTFTIKNFGINTKGSFKGLKGTIKWDTQNVSNSSFNVSVDAATINTGLDARDADLQKAEYFDVKKYPVIKFMSTGVTSSNVEGNLTIKGVTKPVTIPYTVTTSGSGFLFEGNFTINRRDFNVGGSSMVLSDIVRVNLKVQANH